MQRLRSSWPLISGQQWIKPSQPLIRSSFIFNKVKDVKNNKNSISQLCSNYTKSTCVCLLKGERVQLSRVVATSSLYRLEITGCFISCPLFIYLQLQFGGILKCKISICAYSKVSKRIKQRKAVSFSGKITQFFVC